VPVSFLCNILCCKTWLLPKLLIIFRIILTIISVNRKILRWHNYCIYLANNFFVVVKIIYNCQKILFRTLWPLEMMEKFDFKLTIRPNILFLKLVGLWPIDEHDFYRLYTLVITVLVMGLYNVFRVINIFYVYTDLQVLTATIYLTVTDLAVMVKSILFIYNVQTLKQLTVTINCDLFQPKTAEQKDLAKKSLNEWKVTYVVFCGLVVTTLSMWTISPLINNSGGHRQLPLPSWYPYNTTTSPYYEITYVCQVISMWVLATANTNIDSLIAALMMYIGSQCDILCDDLKKLPKSRDNETDFKRSLTDCIIHHKKILRYDVRKRKSWLFNVLEIFSFAQDSNESYNFIILAQFFTSSLAIALTMFQMTLVSNYFEKKCFS
jgi:hypothetical protein